MSVYKQPSGPLGLRKHKNIELQIMSVFYGKAHGRAPLDVQILESPQYSEVREAFRRVKSVKQAEIDNRKPDTFKLSKKLRENRRRNQHEYEEHIKNLASLQRRISSIGSVRLNTCLIVSLGKR